MYQWCYDKLIPYFREDSLEVHYVNLHSIVFSLNPVKGSVIDLKHFTKEI